MDNTIVKLRGYKDGLHLIINPKVSLKEVETAIHELLSEMNQSLSGTSIQIDMMTTPLTSDDLKELETHLTKSYDLVVSGVNVLDEKDESPILAAPTTHSISEELSLDTPMHVENAQVVRQTIRSGQTTSCLTGSVILYGDVNPGGEVIASGDIVVLGALRGSAHAGANGRLSSVIIAMDLVPLQLQIGTYVNRPPLGQKPRGYPEIARVGAEDIIIVEEFIKF
ncbi:septum site-determining protein MinC [Candidatus Poribacteria bacterium]|nr:septum site-determining protein MinC [Candidatus Poribacteria bacterium]MYB63794.1 septum site-determining protein MinC [Candidatus Poribacteria bacterium]MYI92746.1 septum site-determining protein MinC [Candidatus Poribacteria bacterium]